MEWLVPSAHRTYCPFKGEASYRTIAAGDAAAENGMWGYEMPSREVADIAGHLAFCPDRVDALEVEEG